MTHQDIARLPIGTIIHSHRESGCREDVLAGHADPKTGRLATFASLWAGGGCKTIGDRDLAYLHLPEDCYNPLLAQETNRSLTQKRLAS